MSFNKVIILGNIGKDPKDISKNSSKMCTISVATQETTRVQGEVRKTTEWFDVICFGKTAEFVLAYLKKGSQVLVDGKLQSRTYTNREGLKVKTFEIAAITVKSLSGGTKKMFDEDEITDPNSSLPTANSNGYNHETKTQMENFIRETLPADVVNASLEGRNLEKAFGFQEEDDDIPF